jgi:hypothetical protein
VCVASLSCKYARAPRELQLSNKRSRISFIGSLSDSSRVQVVYSDKRYTSNQMDIRPLVSSGCVQVKQQMALSAKPWLLTHTKGADPQGPNVHVWISAVNCPFWLVPELGEDTRANPNMKLCSKRIHVQSSDLTITVPYLTNTVTIEEGERLCLPAGAWAEWKSKWERIVAASAKAKAASAKPASAKPAAAHQPDAAKAPPPVKAATEAAAKPAAQKQRLAVKSSETSGAPAAAGKGGKGLGGKGGKGNNAPASPEPKRRRL